MAVENHSVHERTKERPDARWGCWNLPRTREPLMVKDGHEFMDNPNDRSTTSVQKWKMIHDFGSLDCRNDISLSDRKCVGCQWVGSGEENSRRIREAAAKEAQQ